MNELQVENLLMRHSVEILRRRPKSARRPITLWKPVLATAMGAAAVAGFLVMPRKAEAAPVEKMIAAFKDAKYWHADFYRVGKGGELKKERSRSYFDGKMVEDFGSILFYNFGEYTYTDFKAMPYIEKDKMLRPEMYSRWNDPMNAAFSDALTKKGSLIREDAPNYKGRQVFALVGYGDRHRKTTEILVDQATNLPFHVMRISEMARHVLATFVSEFNYDEPKDKTIFSPNPKKEIINRKEEQKALIAKWSQLPSSPEAPTIYESRISPDGSIWIVAGMKEIGKQGWQPHGVVGAAYGDATDEFFYKERRWMLRKVNGNEVVFTQLVPLEGSYRPGSKVEIEFIRKGSGATKRVAVNLEPQTWDFPKSLALFVGYVPIIPNNFAKNFAKSMYCFEHKNLKDAVRYLDVCMDDQDRNNYWQPEWVYRYAAKCYAATGNKARSEKYRMKADKAAK